MSRQANGTYLQPANTAAASGQTISSTAFNTLITDMGTEITNSVDRLGRSAMQAALPMGGFKITGMADPIASTDAATKNYVDSAASFSTGDLKITLKTAADTGWVMGGNQTTIGNAGSGATYANVAAQALYTLIWNNISSPTSNAFCPVTGGLGASAAADWAGLKPLSTGWYAGRALGFAGSGSGLTARALGAYIGGETATLITANFPPYTPAGTIANGAITTTVNAGQQVFQSSGSVAVGGGGSFFSPTILNPAITSTQGASTFSGTAQGGTSTPVSLMQPIVFVNVMMKL